MLPTIGYCLMLAGLSALLVVLVKSRIRDPFGRCDVRSALFTGFDRERKVATLLTFAVCTVAIALVGSGIFEGRHVSHWLLAGCGAYLLSGALGLLISRYQLTSSRRNGDPCYQTLVLALYWPLWLGRS